jgi:hypothetical protein
MTRENIYGKYDGAGFTPANSDTKIITTLQEARKALNLSETGEVNPGAYPSKFFESNPEDNDKDLTGLPVALDNGVVTDATCFGGEVDSHAAISKSCVIKGSITGNTWHDNEAIKAGTKDAIGPGRTSYGGKSFQVLYIHPGTQEIYVVLDNVQDTSNPAIVVDTSEGGQVYFVIKGTYGSTSCDSLIIAPKDYIDLGNNETFDYTRDWHITYYGTYGSKIDVQNEACFVGCFRTPYTKFNCCVPGVFTRSYKGEDGKTRDNMRPTIVGNALFSGVKDTNLFESCYTASGNTGSTNPGSGSSVVKTEVGYFDVMYMLGC